MDCGTDYAGKMRREDITALQRSSVKQPLARSMTSSMPGISSQSVIKSFVLKVLGFWPRS